jgi:ABC-type multidrug transport system ATPase subunit
VEEYCDTVFVINKGRLVASGNVREILMPHQRIVRVTFDGSTPSVRTLVDQPPIEAVETLPGNALEITLARNDAVWLNQFLTREGFRVAALVPKQKTLKEFFFSITGEDVDA